MLMKENQWSNLVKGEIHLLLRCYMWGPTPTRIPTRFVPYFTFVPSFNISFPFLLLLLLLKSFFSHLGFRRWQKSNEVIQHEFDRNREGCIRTSTSSSSSPISKLSFFLLPTFCFNGLPIGILLILQGAIILTTTS
ncbi:unnamed protein product [Brassica rapa]|uniref:Transmembrane protein n=1 Tax=Brassica campestris TaxID=3711 RepID=A0A3P5Y501_BRACM|nr:unnamed protein product [Brassica rapa]VDC62326.1 unnamed protein product [Brassica rapa]